MRPPLFILAIILVAALIGPSLVPWPYDAIDWNAVRSPLFSPGHLLGTDSIGRDLLARTLVGTRVTLAVAIAAALVSLAIGVGWGAVAGWVGGRLDELMMRIVDGLYALPFMFVVILLMVVFGRSIVLVFVGIGAVEWLTMARVVRGQVIVLKERPFILAAEAVSFSRPGNKVKQVSGFERLLDEIDGALADRGNRGIEVAVAGNHQHRKSRILPLDQLEKLQTVVTASLQPHVEEHQ